MSTGKPELVPLAALRALERFRGRQADPSVGGSLLQRIEEVDGAGASRRREELVRAAMRRDELSRQHAELVYDIALEEGLDPAFGFELVASGVAVCNSPPAEAEQNSETIVEATPEWIAPAGVSEPVATEDVVRERRLRLSFRRLRGELERRPTPEEAILAFASEPDVGDCGYMLE